jgi:hypothetical protein
MIVHLAEQLVLHRIRLLNESDSFENFGLPKMNLLMIVVIAWMIVYFCIWKGVKSTGKV